MLSKAQNKHIRSLTQQKFRNEYRQFVAEGHKIGLEWLQSSWPLKTIVATENWIAMYRGDILRHPEAELIVASESEIESISSLKSPGQVLVVATIPEEPAIVDNVPWYIALDGIQDPGNMGTIIRIADWFGITDLVCSPGCVDVYNPKVVQSAMGGHLRVRIHHRDLVDFLPALNLPLYAAVLGGTDVYEVGRPESGVLVIGNESRGVSPEVVDLAAHRLTIPRKGGAESLNAGVSAGILCALMLPR
jgi:TrmH family RNA methyltransferase